MSQHHIFSFILFASSNTFLLHFYFYIFFYRLSLSRILTFTAPPFHYLLCTFSAVYLLVLHLCFSFAYSLPHVHAFIHSFVFFVYLLLLHTPYIFFWPLPNPFSPSYTTVVFHLLCLLRPTYTNRALSDHPTSSCLNTFPLARDQVLVEGYFGQLRRIVLTKIHTLIIIVRAS